MEEEKSKCIFCKQHHGKLKLFTEESFKKCKQVLKQRALHNLKFKDLVFPEDLYDYGYHRECYKNFTALPTRHYIELFNEKVENSKEVMGNFTPHNLEDKINKVFTKEIKFLICHNKKLLAPKHVSVIGEELLDNLRDQDILNKAALILRKSVLQIEKKNC
ncbi:unnamed protein product [Euphydryas editha]|uniref:PARP-type domain-containing protein n=1 Tax=Euphydryas editha TaxID=104508 RepID=A0AAU9TQK6_EUPED|nr:unnamed protein product [Euphydryas editha]